MSDPFKELRLPGGLVISSEAIESAYREASRRLHPDMGGDAESYHVMREAADLLKCPSRRLRWALESVGIDWNSRGSVPMSVMDLFSPIAKVLKKVDDFVVERERARSSLGRAVLDAGIPQLKRELEEILGRLGLEEDQLVARFGNFDKGGWLEAGEEMAETARGLSFVEKWRAQIQAATGKLFQALLGGVR